MSAKDSQFIERALVHPWMFWVFFWKWPRIVRQVCGEYDLVAKDRDAAKAAHEQAVAANEKVRKWIHVTHQLDATADLRAIWTAGKRLSILLAFFVVTNAFGQAPPYLRNQWTTNANPLALKVISTNGVQAATNVWELDFTNTASVTVSAVSNANKVMVSFTGSASSGSSSLTNALLHAGPTNGSVSPLILTAGAGIDLSTSGTNRVISVTGELTNWVSLPTNGLFIEKTNGLGIRTTFQEWIKVTNSSAFAQITNGGYLGASFLSSSPGSHARANAGGIASGTFDRATNCFPWSFWGSQAYGYFERSSNVFLLAQLGGNSSAEVIDSRDSSLDSSEGGQAGAWINKAGSCTLQVRGGGLGGVAFDQVTNCSAFVDIALGFGYFLGTNGSLTARQGALAVGTIGENGRLYASESAMSVGRNIVSTNSWTLGHHYTNGQDFSFAIGFSGVKQFGVASNGLITIEAIDYNFPNAHAVGALTNNGSGGLGWYDISSLGGGGGIASIFTNNVLAGGPGLTELEFTNTATVTVAATTNAGRVTVSFDASVAGSGIATNEGTGWLTTFVTQTNHSQIVFTNGAKIGATALNTLTITNGHLVFSPDNTWDIGADGANRPNEIWCVSSKPAAFELQNPAGTIYWLSRLALSTPSDGILTLQNYAKTDFTRIQFGGTTDTFPGLARAGAGLAVVGAGGTSTSTNGLTMGGTLTVGGGVNFSRFATNGNVTMLTNFYVWGWTAVAVAGTLTLPSASTSQGIHFIIKDEGGNASATNITIAVQSGDLIDGATTATINNNYGAKNVYSAGSTNWFIF